MKARGNRYDCNPSTGLWDAKISIQNLIHFISIKIIKAMIKRSNTEIRFLVSVG
jgi:hypothetical protein